MNKIDFPRQDVFGRTYSRAELENWYVSEISTPIFDRLSAISVPPKSAEEQLRDRLLRHLPQILLMPPARMSKYVEAIHKEYDKILTIRRPHQRREMTDFGKAILKAFDYVGYRKNKLINLGAWLNVKTCPYCNMSYTLYSEKVLGKKKVPNCDRIARFQFDHFFSKMEYPMLSMSLYNLIPVCPVCNQGKSERTLPLVFHPYYSDIHSLFKFRVKSPLTGLVGGRFIDHVPVYLQWNSHVLQQQAKEYEETFPLEALYSRHGDVVQEVFDKAFENPYYQNPANFSYLSARGADYLKRLWFDDYMTPDQIHKRPLSKLKQDVLEQALQDKKILQARGLLPII